MLEEKMDKAKAKKITARSFDIMLSRMRSNLVSAQPSKKVEGTSNSMAVLEWMQDASQRVSAQGA
jgi:hypothetical protein